MQGSLFPPAKRAEVRLRPYQIDAVERVQACLARGVRRILLVCATGGGKTSCAAELVRLAAKRGERSLFLAHRRELINQAYERLLDFGFAEHEVGVLMASDRRRRPGAVVQVASVDTLRTRAKPLADLIVLDEAHRALAKTNRDLAAHYDRAVHVGLTATPYRADGRGLGDAYDELVVVASPSQLIAEGFLVKPRVFTVAPSALPDLSAVRTSRGDYEAGALAAAVDRLSLVGNLVDHWHKHAAGIRTVVFATNVAHSKHIAERFRAAGVAAEHIDGETITEARDAALRRLDRGETTVLVNCSLLVEGWDQPAVKCAVLARPTKSTGLYLQQAGRILRPYQGQQAIILDHAGCVLEHGLPQDDREFSLESRPKKKAGPAIAPVKTCPSCFAVLPLSTRECPSCGAVLGAPRQDVEETTEELVEVTPDDVRRIEWQRLSAIAAMKGYNPGWAIHRFRERFGEQPSAAIRASAPLSPEERQRAVYDAITESEPSTAWARVRFRVETGHQAPPH